MNTNEPVLKTERLTLRIARESDTDDIFRYASDPDVTRYVAWERHRTRDDTLAYINGFVREGYRKGDFFDWILCLNGEDRPIGSCGLPFMDRQHDWAQMGYVLAKEQWNKGYATEIAKRLISFGFIEQGLKRIEAFCRVENIASERVMQKAGMSLEGIQRKRLFRDGAHHDIKVYAVINEDIP